MGVKTEGQRGRHDGNRRVWVAHGNERRMREEGTCSYLVVEFGHGVVTTAR